MSFQNNDEKIWLITTYSGLIQGHEDAGIKPEGMMELKSLDVLKQYLGANRKLTIAVKVTDKKWNPVTLAEVTLFVAPTNSNSFSLYRYTDSDGIALFEINVPKSGLLNAGVTEISHPCYINDKTKLIDNWLKIRV